MSVKGSRAEDPLQMKRGDGMNFSAKPVSMFHCSVDEDVRSLGLEVIADGLLASSSDCLLGTTIVTLRDQS